MSLTPRKANKLLKSAIYPATEDRKSYLVAIEGCDMHEAVRDTKKSIELMENIKDKKFSELKTEDEFGGLYYALLYAEAWEGSLADSLLKSDPKMSKDLKNVATEYKEFRHLILVEIN